MSARAWIARKDGQWSDEAKADKRAAKARRRPCGACGAEKGERCRPMCIGEASETRL